MANYSTHCFSVELATKIGLREAIILQHLFWWHEHNKALPDKNMDGHVWFFISAGQIAEVFPYLSVKTVRNIIEKLISEGFLIKDHKGEGQDKFNRTNWYALTNCSLGLFHFPVWENGDTEKGSSIVNNKVNNKDNNISPFIPPTKKQVSDYAAERGFIDPDGFAAHFVDYYTQAQQSWHLANGRPMKDWKRAVITWEPGNKYRHFGPIQAHRPRYGSQQATAVDDLLAMGAELYGINTNYDEQ